MGASRQLYSAMAATVASTGYVVLTIDHPHDAFIVEYPTSPPTYAANISSAAQTSLDLAARASDVSFLLDQLGADDTVRDVIPGAARGLDVRRVAMYGHSFGGATAAAAMLSDHRIAGGLNMDGTFYGAVVERGLDRPFKLFSNPKSTPNQTFYGDDSWAETWPRLRGWRRELALAGAAHDTFSDIPLLTKLLGLSPFSATSVTGSVLGTIDGVRGFDVITAYVVAFLDFVLKGVESELLRMPSPLYPEVILVR
ncbi:hypothetical protein HO173_012324 [Letharia columbiana]|uniref:1-alkyl-2-acetylglycerophosphocholine esterase n=1 Tax=Letharia columbiana TaxID=112416 RepID=A0A8H6FFW5_9LECA|nr:uncharacterized protein HO173_012324 [Letharia columbiana]KAF6226820.1 hypothetical protein HO173_012324 [Letharia columbiana]